MSVALFRRQNDGNDANCMMLRSCIVCSVCTIDPVSNGFGLCAACYLVGRRCFNRDHEMMPHNDYGSFAKEGTCLRFLYPHEDVYCDAKECKKQIEGLYFRQ